MPSPEQARLCELEDQSKASKKGMWSEGGGAHTIRDLKYTIENPRNYIDSLHQKPINGKYRKWKCGLENKDVQMYSVYKVADLKSASKSYCTGST